MAKPKVIFFKALPCGTMVVLFGAGAVFIHAIISVSRIITTFAPDFSVFYGSAHNLLSGRPLYHDPTLYTGLGYPPWSLFLFLPFTLLSYPAAQTLWVFLSVAGFFACVRLSQVLTKLLGAWWFIVISLLWFLSFPTKFTFGMGQVNLIAYAWFLSAIERAWRKKHIASGVSFGIALLLKPHVILFVLIFLLLKQWKPVVVALVVVGALAVVMGALFGFDMYRQYVTDMLPGLIQFRGRAIYYNQGLSGFFSRLFPDSLAYVLTAFFSLGIMGYTLVSIRRKRLSLVPAIAFALPVFLMVEPLSWQHHYVFLLLSFLAAFQKWRGQRLGMWLLGISYLLVGANIKHPLLFTDTLGGNLFLSHAFFGNILLWFLLLV